MVDYFENLTQYSPYNSVGSCGFVSLIQALSYYDTFYNFEIIPEEYNQRNELAKTEAEAKLISPGVLNQTYNSSLYPSYYEYCNATVDNDLQSYLTVIYNIDNGTNNSGQHTDKNGNLIDNFEASVGAWDYQNILNLYYDSTETVKVNDYSKLTQNKYVSLIKETIDSGNPAIVHIKKYDSNGVAIANHSVVAYYYDSLNIYANFGWGSYANKYPLLGGAAGYSEIYRVATLDFSNMGHWHSRNYIINSQSFCGCNVSDKLNFVIPTAWTNVPPTFYWMKDLTTPNETYKIEFKSMTFGDVFCSFITDKNQTTLSVNEWRNILKSSNNNKGCWIQFTRISSKSKYVSSFYEIKKPSAAMEHITISPAEYSFYEEYNAEEINSKVNQGRYIIDTRRLRCGYIENECINLSPRKEGAGTAYISYKLDSYVYRIDIEMFLWSENEYLEPTDSQAYIQYKDTSGNWVTVLDLLNDVELSTDRLFPEVYTITIPEKTKEFRIYCTTRRIGDRNKGRLCIGDLSIYLENR